MKQFLKIFFASLLGSLASFIVLLFLVFIMMLGMVSMFSSETDVSILSNTVLEIELTNQIPERSHFDNINFSKLILGDIGKNIGLNEIISNIHKAKTDKNVSAIYIKLDGFNPGGYATIEPIRNALIDFKESAKPVIAHGNYISQQAYYLASVADTIYLAPNGVIEFKGLNAQLTFFKKTLDKLEIEAQIIKVGKFKSAVEPFIFERMSNENRKQISDYINSVNNYLLENIAEERNLGNEIFNISKNMLVQFPSDAKKYGLVDKLAYEVDVLEVLKNITGRKKLKTISIKKYTKVPETRTITTQNRIAVIYAVGDIEGGKGNTTTIGRDNIVNAIRKARKSNRVKGIVMRVNSPGGSALVSDIIWKEVELAKKEKPFVVSYGQYAASGGYYISCGADKIIAEPTTLTGSIGVFSIIPNMKKFFNNKLGVTFDEVKTGKYSDFVTMSRSLSQSERMILQKQVDKVYKTFVSNVAVGRNMTFEEVNKIGQGRIWSGIQAQAIGLVDEFGGLDDAIEIVKSLAGIDDYKIVEYPKVKEPFEEMLKTLQEDISLMVFPDKTKDIFEHYSKALKLVNSKEVMARLPFEIEVN